MSEDQVNDTFATAEEPVGPEAEPTPAELAEPSPELAAKIERERAIKEQTEAMAAQEGFPAQTAEGHTVLIVEKRPTSQGSTVLIDEDGNEYTAGAIDGVLTPAGEAPAGASSSVDPHSDPVEPETL